MPGCGSYGPLDAIAGLMECAPAFSFGQYERRVMRLYVHLLEREPLFEYPMDIEAVLRLMGVYISPGYIGSPGVR
jgi:hypothetical protein